MDAVYAKLVAMAILGLVSLFLGHLPLLLGRVLNWNASKTKSLARTVVLSSLLCFGGGVLLATAFCHMMPEISEFLDSYMDSGLPLGNITLCSGFFLIYLVEEAAHLLLDKLKHSDADVNLHASLSVRRCSLAPSERSSSRSRNRATVLLTESESQTGSLRRMKSWAGTPARIGRNFYGKEDGWYDKISKSHDSLREYGRTLPMHRQAADSNQANQHSRILHPQSPNKHKTYSSISPSHGPVPASGPITISAHQATEHHSNSAVGHKFDDNGKVTVVKGLRNFMTVLALSFHEVLEGLAIGLQANQTSVYYMLAAVSAHKFVISFCLGMELVASATTLAFHVVYASTFALVTPLGILIGLMIIHLPGQMGAEGSEQEVVSFVLQGLAAGTLLYVVFFEVLQRERGKLEGTPWTLVQLLFVMIGFVTMVGLEAAVGNSDHHGHEHGNSSMDVKHGQRALDTDQDYDYGSIRYENGDR